MNISIRQVNPPEKTAIHQVSNPVISPVSQGGMYTTFNLDTMIQEFLFEVTKDGSIFWVGAAVPAGTVDFTRVQIYFHPTVVNTGQVLARDEDYQTFAGGWSRIMQRYVAMEGGQLAGARLVPMIVPFTTIAAQSGSRTTNMFADSPVETLNAIMAAIQAEVVPLVPWLPALTQVGVSSFSNGIIALRSLLNSMSGISLIKEVTDFDSPFIVAPAQPKKLTLFPGAVSRCYTQVGVPQPQVGYIFLPPASFASVTTFPDVHSKIGYMMYYTAMLASVIV